MSEELKKRARKALNKPPTLGGDVDVSEYVERLRKMKEVPPEFDACLLYTSPSPRD